MKDTVDLVGDDDYLLSANGSLSLDNDDLVEDGNALMEDEGYLLSAYGSLVGENDYLQSALCRLLRVNCY